MPAKDIFHNIVKTALIKDGWTITDDPLVLRWGAKDLFVDLGAEQFFGAEKSGRKIAVEVKSFVGRSEVDDLEKALGQYALYYEVLAKTEPERILYVAVHEDVFIDIFEEPIGKLLLDTNRIRVVVFNYVDEVIVQWTT